MERVREEKCEFEGWKSGNNNMQWSWPIDSRSIAIGFPSTQGGESIWGVATPWCNDQNQSVGRITAKGEESGRQRRKVFGQASCMAVCWSEISFRTLDESRKWILWGDPVVLTLYPGRMAADDLLRNEPLVSVEFEVFGKVQGKSEKFYRAEDRRVFG